MHVTVYPEATSALTLPGRTAIVYKRTGVEGAYVDEELAWVRPVSVVLRSGAEPNVATVTLVMDSSISYHSRVGDDVPWVYRMEDYGEQLEPYDVIAIKVRFHGGTGEDDPYIYKTLFRGFVSSHTPQWTQNDEEVMIYAQDFRGEMARKTATGQYVVTGIGADELNSGRPCHFNPEGRCNMSDTLGGGGTLWRFTDDANNDYASTYAWRIDTALSYLTGRYPADNVEPVPVTGIPALQSMTVNDLSVEGLPINSAVERICRHIGWDYYLQPSADPNEKSVLFFFPRSATADAPQTTVRLQPAGEPLNLDETNAERGNINLDCTPIVNKWELFGALEEFEAEFTLTSDWDGDLEDADHPEYFKTKEGDPVEFAKRRDVYRRYILKEASAPFDFSYLFALSPRNATGRFQARKRRFLPCFPLVAGSAEQSILVRIKREAGSDWETIDGVHVLENECGIYFGGTDPPELATLNEVRITAVVQSDYRVATSLTQPRATAFDNSVTITRSALLGDKYHWRYRLGAAKGNANPSQYYATATLKDDFQDDTAKLDELAEKRLDATEGRTVSAGVTIPWLDVGYEIGNFVTKLEGREIPFQMNAGDTPQYPQIVRIALAYNSQTTELLLADTREREGD